MLSFKHCARAQSDSQHWLQGPASKAAKAASEAEADSDSEEDAVPVQRRSQVKTVQVLDDSDDEGDIEIDLSVPNGNKRGAAKVRIHAQHIPQLTSRGSADQCDSSGENTQLLGLQLPRA